LAHASSSCSQGCLGSARLRLLDCVVGDKWLIAGEFWHGC
jgi:hypothetical protein